jgi:hypothetical protein
MRGGTLSGRPLSDRYVRNLLHHQADQANIAVGRCARPGRNCRRSDAISVSLPAHVLSLVQLSRGCGGRAGCPATRAGEHDLPDSSQYGDSSHPSSRMRAVNGVSDLVLHLWAILGSNQ